MNFNQQSKSEGRLGKQCRANEDGRVIVINKELLDEFKQKHTDVCNWIDRWVAFVEGTTWKTPQDIKNIHSRTSFLPQNIVVFDVKGNNYRLEVKVAYRTEIVKVIWAGTHSEYDKRNRKR